MQMIQTMAANNPLLAEAVKMFQTGGDTRALVQDVAKKKGYSEEQLKQIASTLGITL